MLKKARKELAILTTKNTKIITEILSILQLDHFFSVICGGDLACGGKPNKECVKHIWNVVGKNIKPEKRLSLEIP